MKEDTGYITDLEAKIQDLEQRLINTHKINISLLQRVKELEREVELSEDMELGAKSLLKKWLTYAEEVEEAERLAADLTEQQRMVLVFRKTMEMPIMLRAIKGYYQKAEHISIHFTLTQELKEVIDI